MRLEFFFLIFDFLFILNFIFSLRSPQDVVRSMNVNPKISFPPECEFALVSPFIRECCRVAYEMQALEPTLDIPLATDGELMSEVK